MPAIFRAHGALPQWIGERPLPPRLTAKIDEPGLNDPEQVFTRNAKGTQ